MNQRAAREGQQWFDKPTLRLWVAVKHPCFNLGEQISNARDLKTLDLFASPNEDVDQDLSKK